MTRPARPPRPVARSRRHGARTTLVPRWTPPSGLPRRRAAVLRTIRLEPPSAKASRAAPAEAQRSRAPTLMRGDVDVHHVLLAAPKEVGAQAWPCTTRGRGAAGRRMRCRSRSTPGALRPGPTVTLPKRSVILGPPPARVVAASARNGRLRQRPRTLARDEQQESRGAVGSRLLRLPLRSSVPARPTRSEFVRCGCRPMRLGLRVVWPGGRPGDAVCAQR